MKIKARKTPVANWYLDATLLAPYWCPPQGTPRKYHHTTPANLLYAAFPLPLLLSYKHSARYALREALIMISEEGLTNVWARHQSATDTLYKELESLGIKPFVDFTCM